MATAQALELQSYPQAAAKLVNVVQELSLARDLDSVMQVVRRAARDLTGADGATFVLRDGDFCYYAEENAISPLWKGQRFPMRICISGWVMIHAEQVMIEDIYADPRIPAEAYRPTFVKSLAMVPIRPENPIGAIGNYWASHYKPSDEQITILQALANVTSVALENTDLYKKLADKITALETSNEELNRFAWIASHDLKSPLRAISGLSDWIEEEINAGHYDQGRAYIRTMKGRVRRMEKLLDDVLEYAQIEKVMSRDRDAKMISGAELFKAVTELINIPSGFTVKPGGSFEKLNLPQMPLQQILCNLAGNAITHHDQLSGNVIIHGDEDETRYILSVIDDGPGIDPQYHEKIFEMFQTLKPRDVHEGSGMGLSLVKKIADIYGGKIEVESNSPRGTIFRVLWPKKIKIQGAN